MGIGKSLTKIVAPIVMASALAFGVSKNVNADGSPYFNLSTEISCGLGSEIAHAYHIPEIIRTIPTHPDDGGRKLGAMPDSQLSITPLGNVEGRVGVGIKEYAKYDLSAGIRLGWNQYGDLFGGGFKEMNYTNHPGTSIRGQGAALVYYGIGMLDLNYGLFAKASLLHFPSFFAEYSLNVPLLQIISAENGWDRWNALETNEKFSVDVSFLTSTFKFGLELPTDSYEASLKIGLFVGMKIPQFLKKSALADEMRFNVSPCFFGGFQFNWPLIN
jgi:hypothetical protein